MSTGIVPPAAMPEQLKAEFVQNFFNGRVGSRLVSETEDFRIWHLSLAPGDRVGFHRHQLHYFWTAVTAGSSKSHYQDGTTRETSYAPGDTRHFNFGEGEYQVHDLENIGDTELVFVTVESKRGAANPPLDVPHFESDLV